MMIELIVCLACESKDTKSHGEAEDERPNGEKMEVYECEDCGLLWKE